MHTAGSFIIVAIAAVASVQTAGQKLTAGPPRIDTQLCLGQRVTYVVDGGETYYGHMEKDVIVVAGHGAKVFASGGDDVICVYSDVEYDVGSEIDTGEGHNTVITYSGDNTITAYEGNDLIYLNGGNETVHAGMGQDHVWALGATSATIYGESGWDLIVGSPGNDVLDGGSHDDVLIGADGNDTIRGGAEGGDDTLFGGAGFDSLDGGYGFDSTDHCIDSAGGATYTECEIITAPPVVQGEAAAVP